MQSTEDSGRDYFDRLFELSSTATAQAGHRDHWLRIGGRPICLRLANPDFENGTLPALRHLEIPETGPVALTVHAWDSAMAGLEPPPWPWVTPDGKPYLFRADWGRGAWVPDLQAIFALDAEQSVAVFWTADARRLPIVQRGSPLLHIWAWWLGTGAVQFTHAGAVGDAHGAALLLGAGGSGKSSTALQSLDSSLFYLGDDYCLIAAAPEPTVFSLYSSGKVNAQDRRSFPWLEAAFAGMDADKALFQLHPTFADRLAVQRPLKALLVCRVTGEASSKLQPLSSAEVIRASAPSTIIQLHTLVDGPAAMRTIAEIAKRVPAYRLDLGSDRRRLPELIADLLARS
jgi:hypothetical protein